MTAFDFSFVKNTSFAFNGTTDSISFGALNAADFTVTVAGGNTTLTHSNGDFVTLTGFDVAGVASGGAAAPNNIANFTFGSGSTQSRLVVGDQTNSVVTDAIANTINLTGTAWVNGNNLVLGLAGDDAITSTGTGNSKFFGGQGGDAINLTTSVGNNTIYGGDGLTDTTDGNDNITIAGGANFVYGNAGNDVVTTAVATTGGLTNTIYLGLGNDQVADGGLAHQGNFVVYGNSGDDTILARSAGDVTIYGGNGLTDTTDGADTITVGTGSATIYGNSGNDNITTGATAANKTLSIHGGLGNDTVTTGAGVATARATIHGGTGDDRLDLSAFLGDATVYGGNSESDSVDGADTILLGNGNTTLYANGGNDNITIGTALAANKTANVFTGLGNDTINISGAHDTTAKINVTLATGNQVVNLNANPTGGADAGYITTLNGFDAANDKFNVTLDGGDASTLVVSSGFVFNDANGNSQHDSGTEEAFNFASFTGDFNGTNFVIGDGTSKLITNINGAAAAALTGGVGNDHLVAGSKGDTLNGGSAGNDKLIGGSGNDTFQLTVTQVQALDGNVGTIQGGSGIDTLELSSGGAVTIADNDFSQHVRSLEVIKLSNVAGHSVTLGNTSATVGAVAAGVTTVNASAVSSGITTIAAGAFAAGLTYLGGSAVDNVTRGAANGSDNVDLAAGDDTFSIDLAALSSADTVKGGAGTDTLTFSTAGNIADSVFTNVTGFEVLTLANGANTLTGGTAFDASGIVTVTGNANTDTINFSTYTKALNISGADGGDTITGGSGNDTIDGGLGNDLLLGGAGNDRIVSGDGTDTVRGGAGNDTYLLGANSQTIVFENTNNGLDVIENVSFTAGVGGDVFDFKTSPITFDAGVGETQTRDTINNVAGAPGTNGIFVFTNDAVGDATALKAALDATALDTTLIGNRVVVWEINASTVGVGVINNADTADNNGITVTHVASVSGFANQGAVDTFTGALVAGNFDLI